MLKYMITQGTKRVCRIRDDLLWAKEIKSYMFSVQYIKLHDTHDSQILLLLQAPVSLVGPAHYN